MEGGNGFEYVSTAAGFFQEHWNHPVGFFLGGIYFLWKKGVDAFPMFVLLEGHESTPMKLLDIDVDR